jgi:hypothetical protein
MDGKTDGNGLSTPAGSSKYQTPCRRRCCLHLASTATHAQAGRVPDTLSGYTACVEPSSEMFSKSGKSRAPKMFQFSRNYHDCKAIGRVSTQSWHFIHPFSTCPFRVSVREIKNQNDMRFCYYRVRISFTKEISESP